MDNVIDFNKKRSARGLPVQPTPRVSTPATENSHLAVHGLTQEEMTRLQEAVSIAFTLGVWSSGGEYPADEFPTETHIIHRTLVEALKNADLYPNLAETVKEIPHE